ncbi:MAG: hypothetical protein FK732_01600 [Asgard group archaeon]|nr:hypothetical protein [Asgard group archaeon]
MNKVTNRQRRLMKKYTDPTYSLLEEKWGKQKRGYITLIVLFNIFMFCTGVAFLPLYYQVKRAYLAAKELYDEGNEKKLLEYVKYAGHCVYQTTGVYSRFFSLYALVDLKSIEVAHVLKDRLHELRFYANIIKKPYLDSLNVLAIKLDYGSAEKLLENLDRIDEVPEDTIPITKVYFVKKIPKGTQCMVSSLLLDIKEDDIIACPFCGNMAKREHMRDWLSTNNTCPVCRRIAKIIDCPMVVIQK